MSGTTIRRNASTSASGFASCRGPAFRTGSAAPHSGCYGPRLGNGGRARRSRKLPRVRDAAGHFGLSKRGRIRLRCSIDLGELERYRAAGRYDQPVGVGHRSVALRCGGSPLGAGPHTARPCPRSPWMAWTGRDHRRDRRALCTGGGGRAALCTAYDSGALNPGCMPLFVALIAALVMGEKLSTAQKLGLLLI